MFNPLRHYHPEDLEGIVAVTNAAAVFDASEYGTSLQEMSDRLCMPGLIPAENGFVMEEDGRIVAFAFLNLLQDAHECSFRAWFQVHPIRRGRGLEELLLARLYARAEERLGECNAPTVKFNTSADSSERDRIGVITSFGLHEVRRGWTMVRPTLDHIPAPQFPGDVLARAYRTGADDRAVHAADTEAFRDHWGHVDHPFEIWEHYMAEPGIKPELSIVAADRATGEVAGFCMIAINDEEIKRLGVRRGWIDILAVRRPYRRHGLGTALVLAGLQNLNHAGMAQAALGADSENLTGATRIYARAGFQVHTTQVIFSKMMREPRPLSAARDADARSHLTGP